MGSFLIFVSRESLSHEGFPRFLGEGSACLRRRNDKTIIWPIFWVAALAAGLLDGGAAAETTTVQERSALAVPHAETALDSRFSREQWGLEEAEWQRYHTLLQGIRGSLSPATLSPLEVLGIHARDDKERADYAKRWAKLLWEDTERVLAFQHAYDQAFAELDPSRALFDPARRPAARHTQAEIQPGDRLLLFIRIQDCPDCEDWLAGTLAAQGRGVQLDIYAVGGTSDADLRAWAGRHRIDPAAVRAHRITLNHERGELARLAGLAATVPKLVRLRHGAATLLDPRALS
jgi:integrating conjugative element protein (TIGR03759 family)